MFVRLFRAAILGLATVALMVPAVAAQWPTTCLELNDQSEAALGNPQNVGIYQRAFGDGAEAACQRDHLDDVRRTFGWALRPLTTERPVAVFEHVTTMEVDIGGIPFFRGQWSYPPIEQTITLPAGTYQFLAFVEGHGVGLNMSVTVADHGAGVVV